MNFTKKIILLLLVGISISVSAQNELKEGVISMKITMSSENEQVNSSLAMMGDLATTTFFKGQKSRTEMKNPMAGETTTIVDNDAKEMLVLMNNPMLGKKYMKNSMEVTEEQLKNITVTETGDSKTILDYECKGYNVVVIKDGVEAKMTMYTTDKISAPNQNTSVLGGKLKGFPMYMIMNINQGGMPMTTTMEVTEAKIESVEDSKFDMTIPEGYSEMQIPSGN